MQAAPTLTARSVTIAAEKKITVDQIIAEADTIWKMCRQRKLKEDDEPGRDKLMRDVQTSHRDFYVAYPIVCRYMAQLNEYSTRAFTLWIKKVAANPWKTDAENLDAQADYVCILYRDRNPRQVNATFLTKLRTNTRSMLQEEYDNFQATATGAAAAIAERDAANHKKSADELHALASAGKLYDAGSISIITADGLSGYTPSFDFSSAVTVDRSQADDLLG